jgi:nitroreductase
MSSSDRFAAAAVEHETPSALGTWSMLPSWLLNRRSVAVKRLGPPGPSAEEQHAILSAALSAPDHNALRPWRLVLCRPDSRAQLADLFVTAKLALNPQASALELEREREKAERPPLLLALIAAPRLDPRVPEAEQIASAGAALQSILIAAQALGYGAIILSGSRCAATPVKDALGVAAGEHLLGFISIGSIVDTPRLASRPSLPDVLLHLGAGGLTRGPAEA